VSFKAASLSGLVTHSADSRNSVGEEDEPLHFNLRRRPDLVNRRHMPGSGVQSSGPLCLSSLCRHRRGHVRSSDGAPPQFLVGFVILIRQLSSRTVRGDCFAFLANCLTGTPRKISQSAWVCSFRRAPLLGRSGVSSRTALRASPGRPCRNTRSCF
jgi:hypothetical protein